MTITVTDVSGPMNGPVNAYKSAYQGADKSVIVSVLMYQSKQYGQLKLGMYARSSHTEACFRNDLMKMQITAKIDNPTPDHSKGFWEASEENISTPSGRNIAEKRMGRRVIMRRTQRLLTILSSEKFPVEDKRVNVELRAAVWLLKGVPRRRSASLGMTIIRLLLHCPTNPGFETQTRPFKG